MKKLLFAVLLALSLSISARELVLVSAWPPGGGQDVTIRKIQTLLGPILGYPVTVEYHSGDEGAVAIQTLINANQSNRTYVMLQTLALMLNAPAEMVPVSYLGSQSAFIAVKPGFQENLQDCRNPRPMFFGTAGGVNSASNMLVKMLPSECRKRFIHVPYRGGSQGIVDLMAGNIDMFIGSYALTAGYVQTGTLKIAAELGTTQSQLYQDVPMLRYDLYKNMPNPNSWYVFAYNRIPATELESITRAFQTLYETAEFQKYQQSIGMIRHITADSGAEQFRRDFSRLAQILEKQQIKTAD